MLQLHSPATKLVSPAHTCKEEAVSSYTLQRESYAAPQAAWGSNPTREKEPQNVSILCWFSYAFLNLSGNCSLAKISVLHSISYHSLRENSCTELAAIIHQSLTCSLCTEDQCQLPMLILLDLLIKTDVDTLRPLADSQSCTLTIYSLKIKNCQRVYGLFSLYREILSIWIPQTEIRWIVLQPSYCAEIQICFNEHRSFVVIVGAQLKLSLLTLVALGRSLLKFNTVFIVPFPFLWVMLNFW